MAIEELFVIHHTHLDMGYTDYQPVVHEKHVQYLDQVLDLCAATDDYPDECRFRWVSEFSWPVRRFLQERPGRAGELVRRLQEGRIELAGLFLDPTDLMDRRAFEVSLQPALRLAQEHGFAVTTAMTTDIPGLGWSVADVLAEHGIQSLSVAPNAMVSRPILVERPFWWVGPREGRVLVWQTDWRKGWYGEGHVLGFPQGLETAGPRLREYLGLLETEGYPWRVLLLHLAADNYPPCPGLPDLVRQWNEQPGVPRMRLGTNTEFFARMRELHGEGGFPTYRAAWPDWWSEGLGSAAYEAGLSRATHCHLQRIEALQRAVGDATDLWPIYEDLLLFDEHTWGCSNMALQPYSFNARASFAWKASYVYRSYDRARRLEEQLLRQVAATQEAAGAEDFRDQTLRAAAAPSRLALFNALPREYAGPVQVPGLPAHVQALQGGQPVQHAPATALRPARAFAVVKLQAGEVCLMDGRETTAAPAAAAQARTPPDGSVLEGEHFRLRFDSGGRMLSLCDRRSERELLDTRAPWGFAETVHELIVSPEDRAAVWERGYTAIPYAYRRTDAEFRREGALAEAALLGVETGPLYSALTWQSRLPWVRRLETEVRLWHDLPRLDVEVRLDKQPRELYESLYVAFPFALSHPRAFVHCCDASFEAEREQLPGTCRDYYGVQHFAALSGDEGWAVVVPVETPLVQLGQLSLGHWSDHLRLTRACLYGWLTNNFWYTNFPGYQQGELTFRFSLTAGGGALDLQAAERFGEEVRVGLATVAL